MYQKVLVPLDGSKEAEGVFSKFQGELAPAGEVLLFQVVPRARTLHIEGGLIILASQVEESARFEAMVYLRGVLRDAGGDPERWRCETIVAESVAQGILDVAGATGVDLIAMYTHERKGLARILGGSVAGAVRKRASTEVRVFTPSELAEYTQPQKPAKVEVPVAEVGSLPEVGLLKDTDVFKGLSDEQINDLIPIVQRTRVAEGQSLGTEGELGESIFIIAEGEAQLSAHTELGDIAARVAGPGESFPLAILVGSGNLITSAKAITSMDILLMDRSKLLALCSHKSDIGLTVFRNVADLFAMRYGDTLKHLASSVEREFEAQEYDT